MYRFLVLLVLLTVCFFSTCSRAEKINENENDNVIITRPVVQPWAILQAGEFPLWFQLTDTGPVLLETISDAIYSAALIPWPMASFIRSFLAQNDNLLMAVNRDGFLRLSQYSNGTALYRFSGKDYWQHYTIDAFFIADEKPAALLYRDDIFFESTAPLPSPRLWTFNLYSPAPVPFYLPALCEFPPEENWEIEGLRRGNDSRWYFRATKKNQARPEIVMIRSDDLMYTGERVSAGAFRNAALPEPLSAAPETLQKLLNTVFTETGIRAVTVVSPLFQNTRYFALNTENIPVPGFYSNNFLLITNPQGYAFFTKIEDASSVSVRRFSMPTLPEGFVYTGIGIVGDTIFASWEEHEGYSIGAAGFMVLMF